jgi:hypothetical protein
MHEIPGLVVIVLCPDLVSLFSRATDAKATSSAADRCLVLVGISVFATQLHHDLSLGRKMIRYGGVFFRLPGFHRHFSGQPVGHSVSDATPVTSVYEYLESCIGA